MIQFLGRRVIYSIVVLLLASVVAFVGTRIAFDPTARLAQVRDPKVRIEERKRLGIDQPIVVQYGRWVSKFARGDMGQTEVSRERVWPKLRKGLWFTIQLLVWGVLVSVIAALIIGVYSAVRQYSVGDYVLTTFSFMGISIPPFWFAFIAIQVFVFTLPGLFGMKPWFYTFSGNLHSDGSSGINLDYFRHLFLPVLVLTVQNIAGWSRYQRASMLETLNADYVRTARAKGVPRGQVIGASYTDIHAQLPAYRILIVISIVTAALAIPLIWPGCAVARAVAMSIVSGASSAGATSPDSISAPSSLIVNVSLDGIAQTL